MARMPEAFEQRLFAQALAGFQPAEDDVAFERVGDVLVARLAVLFGHANLVLTCVLAQAAGWRSAPASARLRARKFRRRVLKRVGHGPHFPDPYPAHAAELLWRAR